MPRKPRENEFGGPWTKVKLERIRKYLHAYTTIFRANKAAMYYTTHYVDAFAGSGRVLPSGQSENPTLALFDESDIADMQVFYKGSARNALEVEPGFDNYLFIERRTGFVSALQDLKSQFPERAHQIRIQQGDANQVLQEWSRQMDWRRNRSVVFLDPYGMQVDWSTLVALAKTKAVDMWVLLPLEAIIRMLTNKGLPPDEWQIQLSALFGTADWIDRFYPLSSQLSLYGADPEIEKQAKPKQICNFYVERLQDIFAGVSSDYLLLKNRKSNPIFALFFAAANPEKAAKATRIAGDVLRG